jgi:hypothetical protein
VRRAAAVAILSLCLATTASGAPRATLAITGHRPLVITGRHFRPHERVRVRLDPSVGRSIVRHTRASRAGRFSVRFRLAAGATFKVIAVGRRGSRAMLAKTVHPNRLVNGRARVTR